MSNRQKINYSLILIFLVSILIIVITGIYSLYFFNVVLVVLVVNSLIIIFYELWQTTGLNFNQNEKETLIFISGFLKHLGISNDKIITSLKPYVKAYNKGNLSSIVQNVNTDKYLKHYFSWGNNTNRMYILSIIMETIYSLNIREKIAEQDLRIVSKKITFNSEMFRVLDSYYKNRNTDNELNGVEFWNALKSIGVFPKRNNLFLKKIINKTKYKNNKKDLQKFIKIINSYNSNLESFNSYKDKTLNIYKFIWVLISILSIPFSFIPLIISATFVLSILSSNAKDSINDSSGKTNTVLSDYCEVLKVKLANDFYISRYNVQEHKIINYIQRYVEDLTRTEIYIILKEKQTFYEIIDFINKSNCVSKNILRMLFGIAAADKVFSNKEDEYIYMVGKRLNISKEDITKIRDEYLKKGITEKKIQENSYKKSFSNSSSSMYVFYSTKAYKVLGVEKTATNDEIKKAYRKLVMLHHPDKFAMQGKEAMKNAEEQFQILTEAYELIKRLRKIK